MWVWLKLCENQGQSDNREKLNVSASLDWTEHGCVTLSLKSFHLFPFIWFLGCHLAHCMTIIRSEMRSLKVSFKDFWGDTTLPFLVVYFMSHSRSSIIQYFFITLHEIVKVYYNDQKKKDHRTVSYQLYGTFYSSTGMLFGFLTHKLCIQPCFKLYTTCSVPNSKG